MTGKPTVLASILGSEQVPAHLARSVIEERLRAAIYDGRLPCGMAIRQQELATLFGVSRMPVREALRQLEAQGLLKVVHHKGAVVAPLINHDSAETYALRMLLECEALRLSVPLLEEADFAFAQDCIERLERTSDYVEISRLNRAFHRTLYAHANNRRLLNLVDEGLIEEERFLRFNLEAMGLRNMAQDDHRNMLQAARQRNVALAVELLREHLQRGVDAIERYLAQRSSN
ncbi:GntR family transcriptional regulator [Pseudomonas rhizosphaerae]|uniref:GntR family transcriptional regulator n=1 Tax=Pseudomonas rhizosphaerae TaxID=216142 RepID=A0A089YWI5_9PSED|nr:GntR family transcriptional regulator [Pseudomonas rhizosphaerae]AIS18762.1 GntR family transcriptional regulator [Pseudomonas rhizosphaerae]MEB2873045.1 GntR family transcriptional regulator [Pseudomonas rhizosphaerae]